MEPTVLVRSDLVSLSHDDLQTICAALKTLPPTFSPKVYIESPLLGVRAALTYIDFMPNFTAWSEYVHHPFPSQVTVENLRQLFRVNTFPPLLVEKGTDMIYHPNPVGAYPNLEHNHIYEVVDETPLSLPEDKDKERRKKAFREAYNKIETTQSRLDEDWGIVCRLLAQRSKSDQVPLREAQREENARRLAAARALQRFGTTVAPAPAVQPPTLPPTSRTVSSLVPTPAPAPTAPTAPQRIEDPEEFVCPITHRIMESPWVASDGHSYEEEALKKHLEATNISPVTGKPLSPIIFPNQNLRDAILRWRVHVAATQRR
ncbi:hypothetical protein PAPYR_6328 [Paratrimastix pyriformis]|uniref:U-box domain-containing protein n=1 Tax=Paratrimastix pyriformis TaxID=342808 RepID=A0ABQ8UL69_9EUKA|nr:hypothetical protein PAPYR_6328 [Paratrimastix pyriformis]